MWDHEQCRMGPEEPCKTSNDHRRYVRNGDNASGFPSISDCSYEMSHRIAHMLQKFGQNKMGAIELNRLTLRVIKLNLRWHERHVLTASSRSHCACKECGVGGVHLGLRTFCGASWVGTLNSGAWDK